MDNGGQSNAHCTVCPGHCSWIQHKNTRERFDLTNVMETRNHDDLKKKYEVTSSRKATAEEMIASSEQQLESAHAQLLTMTEEAQQCVEKLGKIALKPSPLTQVEYIQLLIESEKKQAMEGWSDRVKYLEEAKQQAELISIMKDVNDIDRRIADERAKMKPGWEGRVDTLDKVKRINNEVENIKEKSKTSESTIQAVAKAGIKTLNSWLPL